MANNRIITLQEDVERVKEESSYQLESRKVNAADLPVYAAADSSIWKFVVKASVPFFFRH